MWQADVTDHMTSAEGIPVDFADIALEHGDALTSSEIDALCEQINCGDPALSKAGIPYSELVEYIALNDEPLILDAEAMVGMPSVQTCAIAFARTYEQVAAAVVRYRKKAKRTHE